MRNFIPLILLAALPVLAVEPLTVAHSRIPGNAQIVTNTAALYADSIKYTASATDTLHAADGVISSSSSNYTASAVSALASAKQDTLTYDTDINVRSIHTQYAQLDNLGNLTDLKSVHLSYGNSWESIIDANGTSLRDTLDTYLPLSGGTMTGDIAFPTEFGLTCPELNSSIKTTPLGSDTPGWYCAGSFIADKFYLSGDMGNKEIAHAYFDKLVSPTDWGFLGAIDFDNTVDFTTATINFSSATIVGLSWTLNGTPTKTPSWYAPTTAGTAGQVLTSTGGEPEWKDIGPSGITNVAMFVYSINALRVSLAPASTLTASTTNWPDGQAVMAFVLPGGAYTPQGLTLCGYAGWPTNAFQCAVWRYGTNVFVNIVSIL